MAKRFFHFHWTVQEFGEIVEGNVCFPGEDENTVTAFLREDLADTFPDGAILAFEPTAVTDANGNPC